jgi:hypothetical protein
MFILKFYRKFVPLKIRNTFHDYKQRYLANKFLRRFYKYYNQKQVLTFEERQVVDFIKKNNYIPVFPYNYVYEYNSFDIEVYFDKEKEMKYVLYKGKRMYFKRSWSDEIIKRNYNYLLIEQDFRSPHYYTSKDFFVELGDIVADVGAAEGIFALENIEKVSKIYLFEYDQEWIEALQCTFAPWEEKVEIIRKFVSDTESNERITLNNFFLDSKIDLIKIDVDGSERELLKGASVFFKNANDLKILICTYHKQDDYDEFKNHFEELNPKLIESSNGFMFFREDPIQKPPFIRRGLLRVKL